MDYDSRLKQEAAELTKLRAENAELRKDAERLNWLGRNPRHAQILVDGQAIDCVFYGISCDKLNDLRGAIDATMGEKK